VKVKRMLSRNKKLSQNCHPFDKLRAGSERSEGSGLGKRGILRSAQDDIVPFEIVSKYSGLVLPLVATIVVFIFLIGIAVLKVGFGGRYIAAMTSTQIAARSAADAGLTLAMHEMNKKLLVRPWDNSTLPSAADVRLPNCRAFYSYTVTDNPAGGYTIASTGKCDRETRSVYAMTSRTAFWNYAIVVDGDLSFKSKTVIDTYPETGGAVDIRTNSVERGAVELFPNTSIPGDVAIGPGGDADEVVQVKSGSDISGQVYAADSAINFPPVTVPGGLIASELPKVGDVNIATGGYMYPSIDLVQRRKLTIVGHVVIYVRGNMGLGNGTRVVINKDSSLVLYLGGSFIANYGSEIINATEEARNLRMYGTPGCTRIVLKNSADFYGAVYAPDADLVIDNNAKQIGSFIGNSCEIKNSAGFYYDTGLLDMDPTNEPSFFEVQRWWER